MISVTCAGFGGQGVLTAGLLLAHVSMMNGKQLSWVPSYGSEMRGGTASCHLRIGDSKILNPFFQQIDVLLALNEDAVQRFGDKLAPEGLLVYNASLVHELPACVLQDGKRKVPVDAGKIAAELQNRNGLNIVMLGALVAATGIVAVETFADGIDAYFAAKGRNNPANRACFMQGATAGKSCGGCA